MSEESREELRARLNAETGKLAWSELERHFARGAVIAVMPGLDLVDVAMRVVEDDKAVIAEWMDSGKIVHPTMDDAKGWLECQSIFWAVVVAPWVFIQEIVEEP